MNTVAGSVAGNSVATANAWSQPSQLFPGLLGQPYMGRKVNILDIGAARPRTLDFFSQFSCKIHIVDIYSAEILRTQADELTPKQLQARFTQLFDLPVNTKIDLCLFWDILNYLDGRYIEAFCAALKPYLHKGSRGHGFGARDATVMLSDLQYSIESSDSFLVDQRQHDRLPCHPISQNKLKQHMTCFSIERGTLFADGRQEMILKARL